jgi:hypothetical protein
VLLHAWLMTVSLNGIVVTFVRNAAVRTLSVALDQIDPVTGLFINDPSTQKIYWDPFN